MIDNHKLEIKAMECFSSGNTKDSRCIGTAAHSAGKDICKGAVAVLK